LIKTRCLQDTEQKHLNILSSQLEQDVSKILNKTLEQDVNFDIILKTFRIKVALEEFIYVNNIKHNKNRFLGFGEHYEHLKERKLDDPVAGEA